VVGKRAWNGLSIPWDVSSVVLSRCPVYREYLYTKQLFRSQSRDKDPSLADQQPIYKVII